MDKTREQAEPQITPGKGLRGDMERLKTNSAATAEELREFVSGLKGRSPQDVLGIVSETGLFKGVVQATVGCIVLLAALTVIPWTLADDQPETETAEADAPAEENTAETDSKAAPATETERPRRAEKSTRRQRSRRWVRTKSSPRTPQLTHSTIR